MWGYFNNNRRGFEKPYTVTLDELNVKIELYCHNLQNSKITEAENEIRKTIDHFKNSFGLKQNYLEQTLKIYIFDDKDDYSNLKGFNDVLGNEGGKCFYKGKPDVFAEIYVYQQGNILNLKHELVHGLTLLATGGKLLPTVLTEGIAEYFEHHSDYKFNSQGSSIDATKDACLDLSEILQLHYSHKNNLVYKTGHALVMYLQERDPSLLKEYLHSNAPAHLFKTITKHDNSFKEWLSHNSTETYMKSINASEVTQGEFIITRQERVGTEMKNVSYYKANIDKIGGENIGVFSTTEHISFYNIARAINRATNDYLDISKEYHFLKVIKGHNGQERLIYCDTQGNDYKDTREYKAQVFTILSKYDVNIDENNTKYKMVYEKFSQSVNEALTRVKDHPEVVKILEELTYINPNLISNIILEEGKIFSLQALGKGVTSALSVYDGDTKIGELLSEVGFLKQIEGQSHFLFEDILKNLHIQYDGSTYIGITKENDQYKASFLNGKEVVRDQYFDEAHIHKNELLHPSINHVNKEHLDFLLLQNTKILDHKDSEFSYYSSEQKKSDITVEKGKLLDNKGTERVDDDVYEATLNHDYTFKNVGFYISEEVRNMKGEIVKHSQLFIHDHGKNNIFQLPKNITHLKLVEQAGQYKLVPCTKTGYEQSEGIPNEYRYIDPLFAHEYEKRDYSHKHVNAGPINFNKYKIGTLFALKHDPDDYQIPKISNSDTQSFTKVKLFNDNKEIGMLSNNFHHFQGELVISADYNYSYGDFLTSIAPKVDMKNMPDGNIELRFGQSNGDIGDTNKGYTDHQKIFIAPNKQNATSQPQFSKMQLQQSDLHLSTINREHFIATETISKNQELLQRLFPNKEDVIINKNLTVEVKCGNKIGHEIKDSLQKIYEAWCENFYQQKDSRADSVKLQLYIFKNFDDYKKYIQEISGEELWGGGTVRVHEADSTIARTFIVEDIGIDCAKSKFLMEKMSDAFLEYATGDFNKVPEILRKGMGLFMWSYNADGKKSHHNIEYMQEVYKKMKELAPYNIINMADDYRIADCLVTFLQEKYPSYISNLLSEISLNKVDIQTTLAQMLNSQQIEKEFTQWMSEASSNISKRGVTPSVMVFSKYNIEVDIEYDAKKLSNSKLDDIKGVVDRTIKAFDEIFNIDNFKYLNNIPNRIILHILSTRDEYENCLKELNLYENESIGLTVPGHGPNVNVYLYLQKNSNYLYDTLKHELGHALTIINSHYGASNFLPSAMHEGIANYIADLENGNTQKEISALSTINNKNLRLDDILNNNYRGQHYYAEAEQVIKFLVGKHPGLINKLMKDISKYESQSDLLIQNFIQDLKNYRTEFSDWAKSSVNKYNHSVVKRSIADQQQEEFKDTILKIEKSYSPDSQGKYKAYISIDYNDMQNLFNKAIGEEKRCVLKFWHKLAEAEYKICTLSQEKYYFKDGNFIISDHQGRKVLPEDQLSIKIMKLANSYSLVISDKHGKVVDHVERSGIDKLNYDLLLDAEHFKCNITQEHSEHDSYLISGLGAGIFDNTEEYAII